jgi:hypothetical protein
MEAFEVTLTAAPGFVPNARQEEAGDIAADIIAESAAAGFMTAQASAKMLLLGFCPCLLSFSRGELVLDYIGEEEGAVGAVATFIADRSGTTGFPLAFNVRNEFLEARA